MTVYRSNFVSKFDKKFRDYEKEDFAHFNKGKEKKKKVRWHEAEDADDIKWPCGSLGEEITDEEEQS